MQPTSQTHLTQIDSTEPGQIVAIAAVKVPAPPSRNPAPATPDRLPLLLVGTAVAIAGLAVGALVIPSLTSAKVQSQAAQIQAQAAELTRIKQCVGGQ